MAIHGRFIPKNPEKYVGDASKIFFRSLWETKVMKWMDLRPQVLRWGSEEVEIPYLSPVDNRVHRYFPDFFIEYKNSDGQIIKEILEVKPRHESEEKFAKNDRSKNALLVNTAKWQAASLWCEQHNMKFRVLTEASIFHQVAKPKRIRKVSNAA